MMLKPWTRWQAKPAYTSVVSDNENEDDEKLSSEPFLPSSPELEKADAKLKAHYKYFGIDGAGSHSICAFSDR
jgi:hypothetical protein